MSKAKLYRVTRTIQMVVTVQGWASDEQEARMLLDIDDPRTLNPSDSIVSSKEERNEVWHLVEVTP